MLELPPQFQGTPRMDLSGAAAPQRPPPFLGSRDLMRLGLLSVFALGFAAVILGRILGPSEADARRDGAFGDRTPANRAIAPPAGNAPVEFAGFEEVKDFTGIEADRTFLQAVAIVAGLPDEEVARRIDPELTHPMLMKFPGACRTRFVQCEGLLARAYPFPSPLESRPGGIADVYEIYLADLATDEVWTVFFFEKPKARLEEAEDRIRIEGMFYKIYTYANEEGVPTHAPCLIARGIEVLPPTDFSGVNQFTGVVLGTLAASALAVLAAWYYNARKEQEFDARLKAVRDRHGRAHAPTPPAAPEAAPAPSPEAPPPADAPPAATSSPPAA